MRISAKFKIIAPLVFALLLAQVPATKSAAAAPAPFPIGIFNPPAYADTTYANYKRIKDMNANFVLSGGDIDTFAKNDDMIAQAAANGLTVYPNDGRLGWYTPSVDQTVSGHGRFVSSGNSLGQTFRAPDGFDCAIATVQLMIDNTNWSSAITLTLSVYDSPSKNSLIGRGSLKGPVAGVYPVFTIGAVLNPGGSYYWELTSNSPVNIGWVCTDSGQNSYPNGSAYMAGSALANYDFWFKMVFAQRMYNGPSFPSNALIDEFADYYAANPHVDGYNIIDEPYANQLTRVFDTVERFRARAPGKKAYVNLFPGYASTMGFGKITGDFVRPSQSIGQVFYTNSVTSKIQTMQVWVDYNTWASNEALTLKLWNSTAKTSLIAQSTLYGGGSNYFPVFTLNANVAPNTAYYAELTHGGGGDGSVGWVILSDGEDWERGGSAYINGAAQNGDMWITVNQNITGHSFEDYVYRWAKLRPDFVMYDHYPYNANGTFKSTYYSDMEAVRRQTLKADVPFWTYIQAFANTGDLRQPNYHEIRYQVFSSLAYGCKGLSYFVYTTPPGSGFTGIVLPDGSLNAPLYNSIQSVNAEILALGPVLSGLTSQQVYHTGTLPQGTTALPGGFFMRPVDSSQPMLLGYLTNAAGRKYVFAVNRDFTASRTVTFQMNPYPAGINEVSKSTGGEVASGYNSSTGKLTATFAPGEGRLFVFPAGY